jgi:1-acyl-sn-glycerol-3-phosphate acyltransferase
MIDQVLARTAARAARAVAGAKIEWAGGPPDAGQRVYVANHTSHLDFVLLWSSLPPHLRSITRPVAARDYWGRTAARRYVAEQVFNALLIDRAGGAANGRAAVDRMLEAMGEHGSLILFPEGTRGSGEAVGPFRSGLYHLCAARPGLRVTPVHLANVSRILPKGEVLPVPMLSRVRFGEPVRLDEGEDRGAFLERARQAVERLAPA